MLLPECGLDHLDRSRPIKRRKRSRNHRRRKRPTLSWVLDCRSSDFPVRQALRLAAKSATRRRPRSCAIPERENCASAPCRLYSTDRMTRVWLAVALRLKAIDNFAFGARARATVAAGAADHAAQRRIVALDARRARKGSRNRAELHRHLSLYGVQHRIRSTRRPGRHAVTAGISANSIPHRRWRLEDDEAFFEVSPALARLIGCRCGSGGAAAACLGIFRHERGKRGSQRGAGSWHGNGRLLPTGLDHAAHRIDDAAIAGAPAEIAGKLNPDTALVSIRQSARTMSRAAISMPGVQKPHCSACSREKASRNSAMVGVIVESFDGLGRQDRRRRPRK